MLFQHLDTTACDGYQSKFDASAAKPLTPRRGRKILFSIAKHFEKIITGSRYITDITTLENALAFRSINFRPFNDPDCNLKSALGHAFNFPLCPVSFDINFTGLSSLLFYLPVPLSCGEQSSRFNPIEIELYTGEMERRCLAKIVWCLSEAETVTSGRRGGE